MENHALELARFSTSAENEEGLLADRPKMLTALKARFPGVVRAQLTKLDDGSWLDVLTWTSKEEAAKAAREAFEIPECAAWFAHIDEVKEMNHAVVIDSEEL